MRSATWILILSAIQLEAQPASLARVDRTVAFESGVAGRPIPRYRSRYLATCDQSRSHILLWDGTGRLLFDRELKLPEAATVTISDIAVALDGTIAVAASTTSSFGRVAPVIAWLNGSGDLIRVVVSPSFGYRRVTFGEDGSLWALGREFDESFRDRAEYHLLRRYDPNGRHVQSALPRSVFASGKVGPTYEAYLDVLRDHLTVVSVAASQWVELSLTGDVRDRGAWNRDEFPGAGFVSGIASTPDGGLFASVENNDLGQIYRYDRTYRGWTRVDTSQVRSERQGLVLLGGDESLLVARIKPPGALVWMRIP